MSNLETARSARWRLLLGRREQRRRDGEPHDLVLQLDVHETSTRLSPVLRGELEVAVARPLREHAEDIAQVCLGVEAVQPTGAHQREEVGQALGVVAAAAEEPGLA